MVSATALYFGIAFIVALFTLLGYLAVSVKQLSTSSPQPGNQGDPETFERIKNLETNVNHLELEIEDLREFIQRGMKRMSARHQRAEMIAGLMDEAEELDDEEEMAAANGQGDMFDPNGPKPRLVRRGK